MKRLVPAVDVESLKEELDGAGIGEVFDEILSVVRIGMPLVS
jgi:hypothetical protein